MKGAFLFSLITLLITSACSNDQMMKHSDLKKTQESKGYIEVDGTKLNYLVEGKGLPCLVIGSSIYYPRTFDKELRDHIKFYFV